jgi:hypothetical protein
MEQISLSTVPPIADRGPQTAECRPLSITTPLSYSILSLLMYIFANY